MQLRGRWTTPAAALLVTGMLTLATAPATAADDPVGELQRTVDSTVKDAGKAAGKATKPLGGAAGSGDGRRASAPSQPPGEPSSQDTSENNEVEDPSTPDHGAAQVLRSKAAGEDVVEVGGTRSNVEDDDSSSSSATLLAVGGMSVIGAEADSDGDQSNAFVGVSDVTDPVCEESDEAVCLNVLFASANATDDGSTSHSDSGTSIFSVCLGGDGDEVDCEAPVNAAVAESYSEADRDQSSGRTTASSYSSLANACLTSPGELPEPPVELPIPLGQEASCALGIALLTSQGQADSGGADPSAGRDSSVASLTFGGESTDVEDAAALELPPGCPEGTSLLCAYFNQGETYLGPGSVAGHAQEAVKADVLPGVVDGEALLALLLGRSETLVHNDGGEPDVAGEEGETPGGESTGPGNNRAAPTVAGDGGLLPNTGGVWSGLLPTGLIAFGLGALLLAASRWRALVAAS